MLLLFAGFARRARAGRLEPICRIPSVVAVMTYELRLRDPYARIRRQWIAEYPSPTPDVVQCSDAAPASRDEASRRAGWPLRYGALHEFRVRAVLAEYVVTFER